LIDSSSRVKLETRDQSRGKWLMIRDEILRADEAPVEADRRPWTTPSVQKLRAGSAEDGGGLNPDAGINPS